MKRRNNSRKPYRTRKFGIKDENIDRQILVLHRAMCEKLIGDSKNDGLLLQQVKSGIEHKYELGQLQYGAYITWMSALELIDNPIMFLDAVLENSARMRKLRRKTPFVGILSEQEREKALKNDAIGETPMETIL